MFNLKNKGRENIVNISKEKINFLVLNLKTGGDVFAEYYLDFD